MARFALTIYPYSLDNITNSQKEKLLSDIELLPDEELVIAHNKPDFFLISTKRVFWRYSEERYFNVLKHESLVGVTFDRELAIKKKVSNARSLKDLKITTAKGEEFTIGIESGTSFSGLWNTLRFLISRNNRNN